MLEAFESNDHDLVFLGDIFDLWIALPRYENELHRRFLNWCAENKQHRRIGLIEGNHEFFVAEEHTPDFTWCTNAAWWRDENSNLFVHGDRINRKDTKYLGFRKLTKNKIAKFIIRYFPYGPRIVKSLKRELKNTNKAFRLNLPQIEIGTFAEDRFAEGIQAIFTGHFHQEFVYNRNTSGKMYILPDWCTTQKIAVSSPDSDDISVKHWENFV